MCCVSATFLCFGTNACTARRREEEVLEDLPGWGKTVYSIDHEKDGWQVRSYDSRSILI